MRGRRLSALIATGFLGLAAAGCGSSDEIAPEVPGPPADFVLPSGTVAPAETPDEDSESSSSNSSGTTDEDATTDEGTTSATPTPTPTGTGTTTPDSSGGSTAPPNEEDSATNDTPPPDGSDAEQFEDFCEQNKGAC